MKSPVYGLGRNYNHRPRGSLIHPSAANVKMKGKKTKRMGCGCCTCFDKREVILKGVAEKEIQGQDSYE